MSIGDEVIRIDVDKAELLALLTMLDEVLLKETRVRSLVSGDIIKSQFEAELRFIETEVRTTVDRLTVEIIGVRDLAKELDEDPNTNWLNLVRIDRATRMILYRIPILRETTRMLYAIRALQRSLKLGEIRGPVTAILVSLIYLSNFLTTEQRKRERLEARVDMLERRLAVRTITMEEAVRGIGRLPEYYRESVIG